MKRYSILIFVVVTLLVAAFPMVGAAQSTDVLFQEAQRLERVQGDYQGAIGIYQQIVGGASTERTLVARALVQMGKAYESLGRTEAFSVYERVVRDFADVDEQVSEARSRMLGLAGESARQPAGVAARQPGEMSNISFAGDRGMSYYGVDLSPDGRYMAFIDGFYRDLQTGQDVELEAADECTFSTMRFSPDGSKIAYGCWGNAGAGVIDLATGVSSRIVDADEYFGGEGGSEVEVFDWTRDGSSVLVAIQTYNHDWTETTNHLILQPLQGGEPTIVDPDYYFEGNFSEVNACLMQDDRFLFGDWATWGQQNSQAYIQRISVDTQERENVLFVDGRGYSLMGCDKEANIIYYQETLFDDITFLWSAEVEEDGRLVKQTKLQELPGAVWAHPITQDGNLYFSQSRNNPWRRSWFGELGHDSRVAQIDGSDAIGYLFDWRNDGQYRMGIHPYSTVHVVLTEAETENQTVLDVGHPPHRWGFLSDNRVMVAHSSDVLTRTWVFDIQSGSAVDSLDGQITLGVMPDGESLVFADSTGGEVCLVSKRLGSSTVTLVTCLPDADPSFRSQFMTSRSGMVARVGYRKRDGGRVDRVFAFDGSMDKFVESNGRSIELLPDGSGAFLIGDTTLDLLDFESGVETSFDPGLVEGYSFRAQRWKLHPDGTRFEAHLNRPSVKNLTVIHNVRGLLDGAK